MKYYSAIKMKNYYYTHLDVSQGFYIKCKKPVLKSYVFFYSICKAFSKWQNYGDEKETGDCQALRLGKHWDY